MKAQQFYLPAPRKDWESLLATVLSALNGRVSWEKVEGGITVHGDPWIRIIHPDHEGKNGGRAIRVIQCKESPAYPYRYTNYAIHMLGNARKDARTVWWASLVRDDAVAEVLEKAENLD